MAFSEKQISLENEPGWPGSESIRPELELAWRGLLITIGEGQLSREQAEAMLRSWDLLEDGGRDGEE